MRCGKLPLRIDSHWSEEKWTRAQQALNLFPVEFLKTQFSGDSMADLQRLYVKSTREKENFQLVSSFLRDDLWPIEWPAIQGVAVPRGGTLLEFMKRPLLSGYNIMLSSGPRVRIRTGNIE
ncbi:MAG: hypothetical protein HC902_14365 [Calothrix sp. SM1_5_4]|nr:hypothetical protein [Calothrix sp. SM1_5_4]